MRALAGLLAGFAAAVLSAAAAAASDAPAGLSEHVEVRLPDGAAGPVPAVVMLSGCGGVRPFLDEYTKTAHEAGWAAVIVDSHAARGIGRLGARLGVCTGLRMRGQERAADVFATLEVLRSDARIDARKIALIGWSHGGWTILDAMAEAAETDGAPALDGVRTAFAVYPYCGALIEADTAPIGDPFPVTMLLVGKDRIADPKDCRRLAERRRDEGSRIEIVFEPDLTHAFDDLEQPWDPRMEPDPAGAERTRARFAQILKGVDD